jgi:hypothetical protein
MTEQGAKTMVDPVKTKSVSLAQFRMLGRVLRGERLPCDRYHGATIQALVRKWCLVAAAGCWEATDVGREMMARRGFMRPAVPSVLVAGTDNVYVPSPAV